MSDEQSCVTKFKYGLGLGFFGVAVPVPQVIAMCTNTNAYNFYSDTAIGNLPNIVPTTVGPALLALLIYFLNACKQVAEWEEEDRQANYNLRVTQIPKRVRVDSATNGNNRQAFRRGGSDGSTIGRPDDSNDLFYLTGMMAATDHHSNNNGCGGDYSSSPSCDGGGDSGGGPD